MREVLAVLSKETCRAVALCIVRALSESFPDYRTSVIMLHQEWKGRETPQVRNLSLTRLHYHL